MRLAVRWKCPGAQSSGATFPVKDVQHFFAIRPVEAFDVGVLLGLAGLDVPQGHVVLRTPASQGDGRELRAEVHQEAE
jgi:hypothetical protein